MADKEITYGELQANKVAESEEREDAKPKAPADRFRRRNLIPIITVILLVLGLQTPAQAASTYVEANHTCIGSNTLNVGVPTVYPQDGYLDHAFVEVRYWDGYAWRHWFYGDALRNNDQLGYAPQGYSQIGGEGSYIQWYDSNNRVRNGWEWQKLTKGTPVTVIIWFIDGHTRQVTPIQSYNRPGGGSYCRIGYTYRYWT